MEDMAAARTFRAVGFMDESPLCEGGAAAARRRRLEIIRFKQYITTGTAAFPEPEPAVKRKRPMTSQSYHTSRSHAGEDLADDSSSVNSSLPEFPASPSQSAPDSPHDVGGHRNIINIISSSNDVVSVTSEAPDVQASEGSQGEGACVPLNSSVSQQRDTEMLMIGEDADSTPDVNPQLSVDLQEQELPATTGYVDPGSGSSRGSSRQNECPPHGLVSVCGRRRAMEDFVCVVPSFMSSPCGAMGRCSCDPALNVSEAKSAFHFFGVFDGHGGPQVASFCADRLHQALAEEVHTTVASVGAAEPVESGDARRDELWLKAMSSCFQRVDEEVSGVGLADGSRLPAEPIAPETVGSTAVVAVVGSCQIVVANCGDSRAVLSRGGRAISLSSDHKPERKDELARIEAAGGRVISWGGYRVLGVLAMSRAIGDRYLKPYVISEPEVTCTQRSEEDECLVLASDGLWDVISNETVCEVARRCLAGRHTSRGSGSGGGDDGTEESPCSMAAAVLMKLAFAKGSTDNISVVVVDLKSGR